MLDRLVELLRPGGLLVTDNVLWDGEVVPGFVHRIRSRIPRKPGRSPTTTSGLSAHPQSADGIVPLRDGVAISVKTNRELSSAR